MGSFGVQTRNTAFGPRFGVGQSPSLSNNPGGGGRRKAGGQAEVALCRFVLHRNFLERRRIEQDRNPLQ